jgi:hypothetical protein
MRKNSALPRMASLPFSRNREGEFAMTYDAPKSLRLPIMLLATLLLATGCADMLAPRISPDSWDLQEDGRVVISIGVTARTVAPLLDQFSKIEISFERKDEPGILAPLGVIGGAAIIYLPPGTWEVTASGYNNADPPAIVAQAKNTLTRTEYAISGETKFALEPTGTGDGTLEYAVTLPAEPVIKPLSARIRIEQGGAVVTERSLNGEGSGVFHLEGGRYIADIYIESEDGTNAVFREAAVILPGLATSISFAPTAEDFLDPEARAVLTVLQPFRITSKNSSRTRIEEASGSGIFLSQRLSAPRGTALVYFVLKKTATQTITLEGVDAAKVSVGAVDGTSPDSTQEVFAVDTAGLIVGDRVFSLTVAEPYKENVVITVTVTIGYIKDLYFKSLPNKHVYELGENFDPSGMVLTGTYSDGSALAEPDLSNYAIIGFDSASVGEKPIQAIVRGKATNSGFTIRVHDGDNRELFFDYGKRHSVQDVQPNRYTVPLGRSLVLAPVKWHIPDSAVYEWKVDNAIQPSATTECFSFSPNEKGSYAVMVTAKIDGVTVRSASTTVTCVAPEGTYKRSGIGTRTATRFQIMYAPGQFTSGDRPFDVSLGAWGGYIVYKFDHSVEKRSGKELKIMGNAFGTWNEPGTVWVMQDEDGDGEPNDTWYELAGNRTRLSQTKQRYAVTYTRLAGQTNWEDNYGGTGSLSYYPPSTPSPITFVGTGLYGAPSDAWSGYVDVVDDQLFNIDDAMQTNGSPVSLAYIDFVKVQTALNMDAGIFGEISTEIKGIAGDPHDTSYPDTNLLLFGVDAGNGQYSYRFTNNSGYDLTVKLGTDIEFLLIASTDETKTTMFSQAYFDYYGGNVVFAQTTGRVTFTDAPE